MKAQDLGHADILDWWVGQNPVADAAREEECAAETVRDVYQWLHGVLAVSGNIIKLGGPGVIVIDKSQFAYTPKVLLYHPIISNCKWYCTYT